MQSEVKLRSASVFFTYHKCINELNEKRQVIKALKDNRCSGVFGLTVNAVFMDAVAGEQIEYFVD